MDVAFRRIAVVNRGESAMRLINAVREVRAEQGVAISTIALHTDAERAAMFVREADEAVCIDHGRPAGTGSPYLDLEVLERALVEARADAAWVGWGFVAERPEFAELCTKLGIVFVGPRPEVMRRLGDKIEAKLLAETSDVPVAAWSGGPVESVDDAVRVADRIGYPLMIKATAGGGGRGIRRVDDAGGLADAFASARAEGRSAFGDPTVFMERVVTKARHVEVQIIADEHGTVWPVGVRDCSMQRRNQKVIEESHCVALTAEQDRQLRDAAARLARTAGYTNAGTVEFLYQPDEQAFAFLEVNTRLQVEHPVTELTTGLDLVKLQLHVASGGRLEGDPPATLGYAVEARLNAEDPQRAFAPAPGTVEMLSLPVGPGIRVDTGVAEGDVIPPEYDSMIAKVIAHGRDRSEAFARLHRALSQMTVLIGGGTTNKSFLLDLLARPEVRAGTVDTSWLDRLSSADEHLPTRLVDVALVAAALDAGDLQEKLDRERFLEWARRGRPQVESEMGREVELRRGGESYRLIIRRTMPDLYEVELDGVAVVVGVERMGRSRSRLSIDGETYRVTSSVDETEHLVEVDDVAHRFSRDDAGLVRAPSAALVVGLDVAEGDAVEVGQRMAIVEAMKMEIVVAAPVSGVVSEVLVAPNVQVVAGAALFRVEPAAETEPEGEADERVVFTGPDEASTPDPRLVATSLLGYDVSTARAVRLVESGVLDGDERVVEILDTFADLCALAPERQDDESRVSGTSREHLNRFLRSLDAEREGLPDWFRDRLERALRRYDLDGIGASAAHADALMRIFVSQQRRAEQVALISALLERLVPMTGLFDALDRVIESTRRRHPEVAALSRTVRYSLYDRPHIDRSRAAISETMAALALEIAAAPKPSVDQLDRLVACPLPLMQTLAERGLLADAESVGPFLEVLTRRFYKIRELGPVAVERVGDEDVCRSSYVHSGRRVHVVAVRARPGAVPRALETIAEAAAAVSAPETVVVDVYLPLGEVAPPTTDALVDRLRVEVNGIALPGAVRRIAFVPSHPDRRVEPITFRRAGDEGVQPYWMTPGTQRDTTTLHPERFDEDRKFRGMHPMIARRLQMWRVQNFSIRPLPVTGDLHLFDCVARDNPADVRLVAVAEVRDLTPVRDDDGVVVALPEVEHVLVQCLDAIRDARSRSEAYRSLEWNRIMLYVWPTVDLPVDELDAVAHRLAPLTEGLGLEQVVVDGRIAMPDSNEPVETVMRISYEPGHGVTVRFTGPATEPMQPLDDYTRKLVQTRRRGLTYPYELIPTLAGRDGTFVEYDLDDDGRFGPVERPPGLNRAGVVVGVVSTPTELYPEGIRRVALLGDPTRAMGSITEAECRRILAAIDLAEEMEAAIEWFALSAGAKIAMDSGSENLDWVARVLRRLVEHTQAGGVVNVVVAGINVGAQPYWNAEATMLMHTKGILVMTPDSSMVLTGKQAIDFSGGVSAEDNLGIGGYERIMGPNGEAQYLAPSLAAACELLFQHALLTYRAPGERWPRRAPTSDPLDRDVQLDPHAVGGVDFTTVGDIFSAVANPDRKKPFDIRTLIGAVVDRDHPPLERWPEMAEAEMAIVRDARLGGYAVSMIGIESRPLPRHGATPADGPTQWSAGTLFPLSSKKVARAINAASGSRPVVMLANLSGFDGSPESLRRLQLEYGAEIGRAIVNFDGPFVMCVVSRYHGGAFVVFSATLNDRMEVLAVEGSHASVIGGAPAAAVVFTRDVDARTRADPRIARLEAEIAEAAPERAGQLAAELNALWHDVRTEKLGEVAAEFDAVHSVERAREVGSVHRIISAAELRPQLIAAVERGMERANSVAVGGAVGP